MGHLLESTQVGLAPRIARNAPEKVRPVGFVAMLDILDFARFYGQEGNRDGGIIKPGLMNGGSEHMNGCSQ
jgi:hypothetical protein